MLAASPNEVIEMHDLKQEILDIVSSSPGGWYKRLTSRANRRYIDYLNERFPQLRDPFYKLSTKIYWLSHDLSDFPVCPICGKSDNYMTKNVDADGYPSHCCCSCTQLDSEVRAKNEATNMRLYGVRNGGSSEQAKERYIQHCQERWGVDNAFQAEEVKKKIRRRMVELHGAENPMQVDEMKRRARKTFVERYHVNSPFQLANRVVRSSGELELFEFVKSLFHEVDVVASDTSALGGFELDIWIPKFRIGIEYDGDYWHSLPNMVKRDELKDRLCVEKRVKLYRVRERTWVNNKEQVKLFFQEVKRGTIDNGQEETEADLRRICI